MALLVAGALALGAATALGLVLSPTSQPLSGSNFEGGNGKQLPDISGHIDWQQLEAAGMVSHTADLGTEGHGDDHFGPQNSHTNNPGAWFVSTQGNLGNSDVNILDLYHTFARGANGDALLYLAMTRAAASGTSFLTFELNQVAQPTRLSNGFPIPCRTTGDLAITFRQDGSNLSVVVQEWTTLTEDANHCARTGELVDTTRVTSSDVQGAFNAAPITNELPGCGRTGCFSVGQTIPRGQFMEAAIDLTKILHLEGEPCAESNFGSIWAWSRTSTAVDADLKDYVAPQPVVESGCPASPTLVTEQRAEIGGEATTGTTVPHGTPIFDTAHLSSGDQPTGTITFHLYGPSDSDCSAAPVFTSTVDVNGNGPYNSEPFTPTEVGTYHWRASYSGDNNNHAVGLTGCHAEPVDVTAAPPEPEPPPPTTPAHPSITTSASPATAPHGHAVGDTAVLTGGADPTGTITFRLFGPNDATCSGPAAFVVDVNVIGNGHYHSPTHVPALAGTYRWVAEYSGDAHNAAAATHCNDPGESVHVESPFPITPTPEEPGHHPRPPHRPAPPPPRVTG